MASGLSSWAALAVLAACDASIAQRAQPIVGGTDDAGDPSVILVSIAGGQCSGVAIAPRVVLTAAHCALPGVALSQPGTVDFGAVTPSRATASIIDIWIDREYAGDVDHDLAALRLDRDAPATIALGPGASVGDTVRLVGYGATAPLSASTRGTRHTVTATVSAVTSRHVIAGTAGATTCIGDSGGAVIGSGGSVQAIISAGGDACDQPVQAVDPRSVAKLAEVIAAWSGACPADGFCDTSCTDPDCDPCRFEGTCGIGCAVVDLDCPVGGGAGAACTRRDECESRICITAPEGADHGAFCSAGCTDAASCPAPLDACAGGVCVFAAGTPGIAGTPCQLDTDCRSALCDQAAGICTVPCGPRLECPSDLRCGSVRDRQACTRSGCAAGGNAPGSVAVVVAVAFRRRRRAKG
jgi:hypothetical protein